MSLRQNAELALRASLVLSYQSECHCAKTSDQFDEEDEMLSYQSECHCAKTFGGRRGRSKSLVTSQNVTAPKHVSVRVPIIPA